MTGSMEMLLLAALAFLGLHVLPSSFLRSRLVGLLGERLYLAGYSLLSILGLVWLVLAYRAVEAGEMLWTLGNGGRWLGMLMMLLAFILLVGGVTSPNPTATGGGAVLEKPAARQGFNAITRHPVMWAIALWAVAHLLNNGHLPGLILFGSLGLLALAGTFLIDAKKREKFGPAWADYAAATSNFPFLAVLQGRATGVFKGLWWRLALGFLAYGIAAYIHTTVFGRSILFV